MKNFTRSDLLFSLCGLNCGLCSMHLSGHCPGCGGGEGNQSCRIARCSLEHKNVEYCSQCREYPCEKYEGIDEFDFFITHRNQKKDLEKRQSLGTERYQEEQREKIRILQFLLEHYNDGRKKTFFCLAVNLLELEDLKAVLRQTGAEEAAAVRSPKEKAAHITRLLQNAADERGIILKLRKRK